MLVRLVHTRTMYGQPYVEELYPGVCLQRTAYTAKLHAIRRLVSVLTTPRRHGGCHPFAFVYIASTAHQRIDGFPLLVWSTMRMCTPTGAAPP